MVIARNTILIVEDDPDISEFYRLLIEKYFSDLAVVQTPTLAAALHHVIKTPPILTLLDIELPDGNGLDWLQTNSQHLTSVLVISSLDKAKEAVTAGASKFVNKTHADVETLRSTVQALLPSNHQAVC